MDQEQIKMAFRVTRETPNGWKQLTVNIEVEAKPRWWQFWKTRIDKQTFVASTWIKTDPVVMSSTIEEK